MTHGVLRVLGSNPAPFHWQELPLVVPNPTPQHFVSRTLVSLLPFWILRKYVMLFKINAGPSNF